LFSVRYICIKPVTFAFSLEGREVFGSRKALPGVR
jgi:hypothetical protein